LSNFERAEYHLRLAVKFAPEYPAGYLNYGNLLLELGEYAKLGELANKAINVRGIHKPAVYHFMAVVAEMSGDLSEAMKWLGKAKAVAFDEGSIAHIKSETRRVKGKMNTFSRIAFLF
jgi:tetratricopeptide (TPR) repeat protein